MGLLEYLNDLPTKQEAAGCVIFNRAINRQAESPSIRRDTRPLVSGRLVG